MSEKKVITFTEHVDEFYFLGIKNTVTENSDFGEFWNNFFERGGYDKICKWAKDPNCVNVWYNDETEGKIYFQGQYVDPNAEVSEGYSMMKFPAGDYLIATTEWLESYQESMKHINPNYYKNAQPPQGYRKRSETDDGIFLIERWGEKTVDGFRYEYWVPIEKI